MSKATLDSSPYRPLFVETRWRPLCPDGFHVYVLGLPRCQCGKEAAPELPWPRVRS